MEEGEKCQTNSAEVQPKGKRATTTAKKKKKTKSPRMSAAAAATAAKANTAAKAEIKADKEAKAAAAFAAAKKAKERDARRAERKAEKQRQRVEDEAQAGASSSASGSDPEAQSSLSPQPGLKWNAVRRAHDERKFTSAKGLEYAARPPLNFYDPERLRRAVAPLRPGAITLQRFLIANKGNVDKAARQYRAFAQWRKDENIDSVLSEPPHAVDVEAELRRVELRLLDGYDRKGRPVVVGSLGALDLTALHRKGVTSAMLIRRHVRVMEALVQRLEGAPQPLAGHLLLLDLQGFSASKFMWAWAHLRQVAKLDLLYYPEVLGQLCFVRAPEGRSFALDTVRWLLQPPSAPDKVLVSTGEPMDLLKELLPRSTALPADMGIATWPPADDPERTSSVANLFANGGFRSALAKAAAEAKAAEEPTKAPI